MNSQTTPEPGPEHTEGPVSGLRSDYRPERLRQRRPPPKEPGGARAWWWLTALLLVPAVIVLLLFREPIAERLLPTTDRTRLLTEADAALAEGRLSSPADGRGARELYTAVLALEPDHPTAREGLRAVALAAVERAGERLAEEDLEGAREFLALARSLALPRVELAPVEDALRQREAEESELARLLQQAEEARREDRLDGSPDSALALYRRAREAAPDSAVVQAGLRGVTSALLQRALWALQADDAATAEGLIERVNEVDPGHLELPTLRARLAEWRQDMDVRIEELFDEAELARHEGRLEEAAANYRTILAADPVHAGAREGMDALAGVHAGLAAEAAMQGDFAAAEDRLAIARDLAPGNPAIAQAERELSARTGEAAPRPRPMPADNTDVDGLLAKAAAAVEAERFVEPPGDSAWDLLRAARSLAHDDPRIGEAITALTPAALACMEENMRGNRLTRAKECLEAAIAMTPGEPALPAARRRLAARWIGLAEERLGAGELQAARRAYESAREVDAAHPDLLSLAARLEQAEAPTGRNR